MPPRRNFGSTWWGSAWVDALEQRARLDPNRLPRGRTYARQTRVGTLHAEPGAARALVQGSRPSPYSVQVRVRQFTDDEWVQVLDVMAGRAAHAAALLDGELPPGILDDLSASDIDLLPIAGEVGTVCSCPDWADPCKHAAAVCYLIADLLDHDPFNLFLLRGRTRDAVLAGIRSRRRTTTKATRGAEPGTGSPLLRRAAVRDVPVGVVAKDAWRRQDVAIGEPPHAADVGEPVESPAVEVPSVEVPAAVAEPLADSVEPMEEVAEPIAESIAEPGVAIVGSDAVARLSAVPRLPLPPHPGLPAPLAIDPPPASGIRRADLNRLATDAARRAWEMLTGGSGSGLELSRAQDLARRGADVLGTPAFDDLAQVAAVPSRKLAAHAIAWSFGGAEGVDLTDSTWNPPSEQLAAGRAVMTEFGLAPRVRDNRVGAGTFQLRLGRSGLWYRFERKGGAWELVAPPDADPGELLLLD